MRKLVTAIIACVLTSAAAFAEPPVVKVALSGKVLDEKHKPIARAMVELTDTASEKEYSDKTDKEGDFYIEHPPFDTGSLRAYPLGKQPVADAFIKKVDAKEDSHIVVTLKPGFLTTGKVVSSEPIKGLIVKVSPEGRASSASLDTVHGSGLAAVDNKGRFSMRLTRGPKVAEVLDAGGKIIHSTTFTVEKDTALKDIVLSEPAGVK